MKINKIFTGALFIILVGLAGCGSSSSDEPDFSGLQEIGDLTTLRCYYHNVAKSEVEASGMFKNILKTGYKKLWTEYDGIVDYGIDINEVEIATPDEDGVIEVYVPEAEVKDAKIDSESIEDSITDKGAFTSITKDEETDVLANAQEQMEEAARKDKGLLKQAKEHAKEVIEGYIVNVGQLIGQNYTVKWVEED